ncbi:IS982 family transposase, partial [Enterococcus faecalis]
MQSQLQNTQFQPEVQTTYQAILEKVEELYLKFVPDTIRLRRNINQQKQPDTVIISTIIWGMMMGFPTQISTYQAVCALLYPDDFPSHSRYNR